MNRSLPMPGLYRADTAVVLSGPALRFVLDALLVCIRHRRLSGLSITDHTALVTELRAAVAANGHADVPTPRPVHDAPMPTMPIADAATELHRSVRQTRRLAPQLGGRIIAGRWLLDPAAVAEHLEGQH